ncbi:metalloprotease PmbA [Legionella hackeliae]|uniref:Peptidase required for the maturation and secretion of the antibiotic peptide MccB17 n=1 Tax=Legionella hackeliae TaxID=449 RepID=A0A0A8UWX5_LEGHA|nr:metalloprotease PmbA [Legionella hackeliae]KTD15379.1 peptide maturation protein PmbA [Legionella hackeliae]CEK11254.1 peptidase required for the maturation and secretion of the antibiotic peptide MccB17 [Legionella hackeliae]STX48019.1 peptide maturation protein PmbA [Legionella hackeliae]
MRTLPENNNRVEGKSTSNLSKLMHEVLDMAKAQGATDAMVSVNNDSGFSVDVRMGEVETVAFNEDKGISLVVYIGNRKGAASSTDTSPAALSSLVTAACEIAKVSAEDPCFGLADRELMTTQYPDLDLYHPWTITPQEAIEMALSCESHALSLDKRISNSDGVNLSTHAFCNGFANTYGGEGIIQSTRHGISCSLIAKEGETMQRDYEYTTARHANALQPLEQIAKTAAERATSRLGARQLKTQKVPVLFSSRISSGLLSSFINAVSGGNLYRKNSFLLDSIGKAIFPKGFKIYEQPHLLRGLGSSPFDSEGVPTRNNIFIEDGILQQYVLGSYSARRMGLKTTANGGGVHNLTIDATAGGLQELLKEIDRGLLVTELMGQGVNGLTGDYSRGASGFWVENGELQYPVEEITIASNLKDMFKAIVAVGTDINPNYSTRCGSVLIKEMMVAGE